MNINLLIKALFKFLSGLIPVFCCIFIPAGSFEFKEGFIFLGILFIPMFITGIILFIKNPQLLEKRIDIKEEEKEQKKIILCTGILFIAGFIISGLNFRFSIIKFSKPVIIIAIIVFIISYILYGEILRENIYLSRTVKVSHIQKVIDKGLYSFVRHPMYLISIILFLSAMIILNSPLSFILFLLYPFFIIKRIKNEEMLLEKELIGYIEYKKKVKYRLFPFIW